MLFLSIILSQCTLAGIQKGEELVNDSVKDLKENDQNDIDDLDRINDLQSKIQFSTPEEAQGSLTALLNNSYTTRNFKKFLATSREAIDSGADVDTVGVETVLTGMIKMNENNSAFASLLVDFIDKYQPNLDLPNSNGEYPINIAASSTDGAFPFVLLINRGANPGNTDQNGLNANHLSLMNSSNLMRSQLRNQARNYLEGEDSIYKIMVEREDFDLNSRSVAPSRGFLPAALAAVFNNIPFIEIAKSLDPNILEETINPNRGRNSIQILFRNGESPELFSFINSLSSDLINRAKGINLLTISLEEGLENIFTHLAKSLSDEPLHFNFNNEQDFVRAVVKANSSVILDKIVGSINKPGVIAVKGKKRLDKSSNIWRTTVNHRNNILHIAARHGSDNIFRDLVELVGGEAIISYNLRNETPLHILAGSSYKEEAVNIAKIIKSFTPLNFEMGPLEHNPAQIAAINENAALLSFFIKKGGLDEKIKKSKNGRGSNTLFLAIESLNPSVMRAAFSSNYIDWSDRRRFTYEFNTRMRNYVRNDFFNHFVAHAFGIWGLPHFEGTEEYRHFALTSRISRERYFKCLDEIIDTINRNNITTLQPDSNSNAIGNALTFLGIIAKNNTIYDSQVFLFTPEEFIRFANFEGKRAFRKTLSEAKKYSSYEDKTPIHLIKERALNRAIKLAKDSLKKLEKISTDLVYQLPNIN